MSNFTEADISRIPTKFGDITLIMSSDLKPTILAAGFGPAKQLANRLLATRDSIKLTNAHAPKGFLDIFVRWSDGDLTAFSGLRLDQVGSKFRQECWQEMLRIPAGKTLSYSELAGKTSSVNAVRAAATACASNLIAPLIPCHRIIRSDGTLGKYGYGEKLKARLLEFEGVDL
ncbi:MAG: methylated-DNA--[protein]-cysteine S-methyltransferase [Actinomycetales bacterium]|nr:methylated-DNA--[protein]-cysteine S-methyltransferase [Actinomycetales bacterium]